MKFYKCCKDSVDDEKSAIHAEFERLKTIAKGIKASGKSIKFKDICNRRALKQLGIGVALNVILEFSGGFTILTYATMIFQRMNTPMDSYVCSIMLAIALIIGSILSTSLADKLGRKRLNLISLFGSAAGLFAAILYHYLHLNGYNLSGFGWVPVVSLSFVVFITSVGIWALSGICAAEILSARVCSYVFENIIP